VGMAFGRTSKGFRQHLLRKAFAVKVEREPENEHDPNAIKVLIKAKGQLDGMHIGYLKREIAEVLAPRMDIGAIVFRMGTCESVDVQDARATLILRFEDAAVKRAKRKKAVLDKR
jgi:hypothetical protein